MSTSMRGSTKVILTSIIILLLGVGGAGVYLWQQSTNDLEREISQLRKQESAKTDNNSSPTVKQEASALYTSKKGVTVYVYTPAKDSKVASGVWVLGMVPGSWSFEASFPVRLVNSAGQTVAQGNAELLDGWTTDKQVPFKATLEWSIEQTGNGTLVLQKDNPSGFADSDDSVTIPVKF